MQKQNQSRLGRTRFPALGADHVYLLLVLIGSLCCFRLLWLVIVIALVLVWRHSIENRSTVMGGTFNDSIILRGRVTYIPWLVDVVQWMMLIHVDCTIPLLLTSHPQGRRRAGDSWEIAATRRKHQLIFPMYKITFRSKETIKIIIVC